MAFWVIEGFDAVYGGLHGMIEREVFEGKEDEATARMIELSESVIGSYREIMDLMEDEIREFCKENDIDYEDEDASYEIREEVLDLYIDGNIWLLDEKKLPTKNLDKLEDILNRDPEGFIEEYRDKFY